MSNPQYITPNLCTIQNHISHCKTSCTLYIYIYIFLHSKVSRCYSITCCHTDIDCMCTCTLVLNQQLTLKVSAELVGVQLISLQVNMLSPSKHNIIRKVAVQVSTVLQLHSAANCTTIAGGCNLLVVLTTYDLPTQTIMCYFTKLRCCFVVANRGCKMHFSYDG